MEKLQSSSEPSIETDMTLVEKLDQKWRPAAAGAHSIMTKAPSTFNGGIKIKEPSRGNNDKGLPISTDKQRRETDYQNGENGSTSFIMTEAPRLFANSMPKSRATTAAQASKSKKQCYDHLIVESKKWIREMEGVRDEMYRASMHNAILLDFLAMQALDEPQELAALYAPVNGTE